MPVLTSIESAERRFDPKAAPLEYPIIDGSFWKKDPFQQQP
jgi:hypothetical protein